MLKFVENKEKSDSHFKILECEIDDVRFTIIQWKGGEKQVSAFVRRFIYDESKNYLGYIEIWEHRCNSLPEAKRLAEKMYDIVLWYKPCDKWKD